MTQEQKSLTKMTDGGFLYDDINDHTLQSTILISSIFTKNTFDLKKHKKMNARFTIVKSD